MYGDNITYTADVTVYLLASLMAQDRLRGKISQMLFTQPGTCLERKASHTKQELCNIKQIQLDIAG